MSTPLLTVESLRLETASGAVLVRDLSFRLDTGERLGMLGESGSGKTLTGLAVAGLLPATLRQSGHIEIHRAGAASGPRRGIGLVFQEPYGALNPVLSLGFHMAEALRSKHGRLPSRELRRRSVELLRRVAMPDPEARLRSFPHQLSGGQRQRAVLALALAGEPRLLIADEPTTALDTTVQAQILDLLDSLAEATSMAVLLITHDWTAVARLCDRVLVMHAGERIEEGPTEEIYLRPSDPRTRSLSAAGGESSHG